MALDIKLVVHNSSDSVAHLLGAVYIERLRVEDGLDSGYTPVKDYVREHRRQTRQMLVPLSYPSGKAQCHFGEALVVIGGVERKAHYFILDLPHSDSCFIKAYSKAYSAETTEAFLDDHVSVFAILGGVPQSIFYDNTKLAVTLNWATDTSVPTHGLTSDMAVCSVEAK